MLNDSKYNPKILFQLLLDTAQFEFTLKEVRTNDDAGILFFRDKNEQQNNSSERSGDVLAEN